MIFYFIPLIILILYNIKLAKPKGAEYLFYDSVSKDKSVCIKGIFAIIIMFSHVRGYIVCDNFFDNVYDKLLNFIGQQMVVMFLLYSGYGIIKSMRNNPHYMNDFLYKRVFRTHYHFLVALVFYIFIALVLGKGYSLVDYCFSLIGWSSIGNSNWYIFDTLVLYLITYFSFVRIGHPGWKNYYSCIIFSLLICIFILFLKIAGKQTYWYDTVLAFPLGMIFALCESKINNLFRKRQIYYWSTLLIAAAVYIFVIVFKKQFSALHYVQMLIFPVLLSLILMKISIKNSVLLWLGKNSFAIYILQRIPMIILSELGLSDYNKYLFAGTVFAITILISWGYTKLIGKFDRKLFPDRTKAL